jgi:hypothetical protein
MIDNVSHKQLHSAIYAHQNYRMEASVTTQSDKDGATSGLMDSVSIESESSLAVTYSTDMKVENGAGDKFGLLQSLVANLLKEQGINTNILTGDTEIDIATITPEAAQELVADDGYFGVEKTSDRIFQFAVGVAGGDPSRIDAIREGIANGFNEALEAFGGWLPDISYATYDTVMEKLDSWVAESETVA